MGSATRESLAATRSDIESGAVPLTVATANGFFTVADAMRSVPQLRMLLSDPSTESSEKVALVSAVFGNTLPIPILDVVARAVARRWSNGRDLMRGFVTMGTMVLAGAADQAGRLADLGDELFAVSRVFAENRELQLAVGGIGRKDGVVTLVAELFETRISAEAYALVEYAATHNRGGRVSVALEEMVAVVADYGSRTMATVTTAVPVSSAKRAELAAALEQAFGEKLQTNFVTDASIIGGVRAEVGAEIIDGTTKTKLAALRSAVVG